jgi:hypothetical protein
MRHEAIPRFLRRTGGEGFGMRDTNQENDREARAGRNQSLFREVNERIQQSGVLPAEDFWPENFFCECGHETCVVPLRLTRDEYEAVRRNARWFFVAPSDEHFLPHAEVVIEKKDDYWIVEKFGRMRPWPRSSIHARAIRAQSSSAPPRTRRVSPISPS